MDPQDLTFTISLDPATLQEWAGSVNWLRTFELIWLVIGLLSWLPWTRVCYRTLPPSHIYYDENTIDEQKLGFSMFIGFLLSVAPGSFLLFMVGYMVYRISLISVIYKPLHAIWRYLGYFITGVYITKKT